MGDSPYREPAPRSEPPPIVEPVTPTLPAGLAAGATCILSALHVLRLAELLMVGVVAAAWFVAARLDRG